MEQRMDEPLKLEDLAAQADMSPAHFHRTFKTVVGLSPKQYLDAARLRKLKQGLRGSGDVTEAVYAAGYGSSSRVYELADTRLGMTPNQYRHVQSYGEVTAGIGNPTARRAVARACATNRVALVIPCHRVIRGTGELGGYRWGLARKRMLIDRERAGRASMQSA